MKWQIIITATSTIIKFLIKLDLDLFFSKPQIKHVEAFISAMVLKGFNGKITDVADLTAHSKKKLFPVSSMGSGQSPKKR